jgi:hypothetical protein
MMRSLVPGVLGLLLAAGPVAAQAGSVRGRVVDRDGGPVVDQAVLLHRVVGMSGANIAQARSDSAGRFVIPVDSLGGSEATYFLAARWQDELYIGEAFKEPLTDADHVLQVGVPGTSATALLEGTTPRTGGAAMPAALPAAATGSPATGSRWLLFLVPGVALAGVLVYVLLRQRPGISPRRQLLVRVAELDLANAAGGDTSAQDRRAELIAQLRETPGP